MRLRDYQRDIYDALVSSRANDLVQLDTGAGKTPIEAALAAWAPRCLLVAHRNVLVEQLSEKLAAFGVDHDTISSEHTRRRCMLKHRRHGRNFIKRGHATRLVASIDGLASQAKRGVMSVDAAQPWLIVIDEAHHVVPGNKWGKLREVFPNSRVVGFTATPARMDGKSLHVDSGGIFDSLIQAKELGEDSTRKLINRGYLSDFIVFSADIARRRGDDTLTIIGDPVAEYRRHAGGRRAIMVCPSIRNAEEFAAEFRDAGIPAASISSAMGAGSISRVIDAFSAGDVLVLTNVDMVGEGFDLPACEALIVAARTASFARYRQWVGRVLRPCIGKERAVIIDHVGMVAEHGMPDSPVNWDLIKPPVCAERVSEAPCEKCGRWFSITDKACPDCGWPNALAKRAPALGEFYVAIKRLDYALVARAREAVRQQEIEDRLHKEIVWPYFPDSGPISRGVNLARREFVTWLEAAGKSFREINEFLGSQVVRDERWWMNLITIADAKNRNEKKMKMVWRAWKRSN